MGKKFISAMLAIALLISGTLSIVIIHGLEGNARVINYAGVVRGATQRLVKQELAYQPNDALMARLDEILEELSTGSGPNGLSRLDDADFQALLAQMQEQWAIIKAEIGQVRGGQSPAALYALSETYFDLADRTVSAAEVYAERQVAKAKRGLILLSGLFLLLSGLMAWYGTIQDRRQRALTAAENDNRLQSQRLEQLSEDLRVPMNEISELIYV